MAAAAIPNPSYNNKRTSAARAAAVRASVSFAGPLLAIALPPKALPPLLDMFEDLAVCGAEVRLAVGRAADEAVSLLPRTLPGWANGSEGLEDFEHMFPIAI